MAKKEVVVRLVPKSRSHAPRREFFGEARSPGIDSLVPNLSSAHAAMQQLSELSLPAVATARDRLETRVSPALVQETFKVELVERELKLEPNVNAAQTNYFAPKTELTIPDELKDEVEFAYIPRPVLFYSALPTPPQQSVFHLTLDDVRTLLRAGRCHRRGWTGKGIKVAMADTGFFMHPYFVQNGYSLIPTASPGSGDPSIDDVGHGTGEAANIFAMAPDCTVLGVKHGNSAASTLETCVDLRPDIMTNSWGWDSDNQTRDQIRRNDPNFYNEIVDIETVVLEAVEAGITVFFSAGNGHRSFPASIKEVIAVGGVSYLPDGSLTASSYASSFKSKIYPDRLVPDFCGLVGQSTTARPMPSHIMLPVPPQCDLDGENFAPAGKGAGWGIFSGTSAASPQAAGVAALVKGANKALGPGQIRSVLQNAAIDIVSGKTAMGDAAKAGKDLATGSGLLDALQACETSASP
jgi:subtilisin family serine protease